jgi:hypothetical protein
MDGDNSDYYWNIGSGYPRRDTLDSRNRPYRDWPISYPEKVDKYSRYWGRPIYFHQLQFLKRLIILKSVVISVGYHVSVKALPSSFANVG